MENRFKALRAVALVYRILAWITLVVGVLFAFLVVVLGVLQARRGQPSPVLTSFPLVGGVRSLATGLLTGLGLLGASFVQFLLLYAGNEVIQLGLAVEENTRETALYLCGEGDLPVPPQPDSWQTPAEPGVDEGSEEV